MSTDPEIFGPVVETPPTPITPVGTVVSPAPYVVPDASITAYLGVVAELEPLDGIVAPWALQEPPAYTEKDVFEASASFFQRLTDYSGTIAVVTTLAPNVYGVVSQGETFLLIYTGEEVSGEGGFLPRVQMTKPRFSRAGFPENLAVPLKYVPHSGRFIVDESGKWFLSSDAIYGYGWKIDYARQVLIVSTDEPGSYRVQFVEHDGFISVEVPDDWSKTN